MASYKMVTQSGLDFYVCASVFQKSIRRGDEHLALYYGTEFFLSGYDEYVWFRLRVIVSEDIGLVNTNIAAEVNALYDTYLKMKKKKNKHKPEKLQFVHAIMLVVRSKKSRLVDNKLCYYFDHRDKIDVPEIPDYVYDMHTIKGKIMKRGNDHFYEESAKIENVGVSEKEEYEYRDFVWKLYQQDDLNKKTKIDEQDQDQQELF